MSLYSNRNSLFMGKWVGEHFQPFPVQPYMTPEPVPHFLNPFANFLNTDF